MKNKDKEIDFLKVILYSHAFWEYFHNLYLNKSKNCPADKLFFEHSWIIIYLKRYGILTLTDLVKFTNKKQSTLSRALSTLVNAGFIKKIRNKKSYLLSLTESGEKIYDHLNSIYDDLEKEFKKNVEESKVKQLIKLLKDIDEDLQINLNEYKENLF